MRIDVEQAQVILGEQPEERFGSPYPERGELEAVQEVSGGSISDLQDRLDAMTATARRECPEANCCLRAVCRSTRATVDDWDHGLQQDMSWDFDTVTVTVGHEKRKDGCGERAQELTEAIGEYASAAVAAKKEADKQAGATTRAAEANAKEVLKDPQKEATRIRREGRNNAAKQRREQYSAVHKQFKTRRVPKRKSSKR